MPTLSGPVMDQVGLLSRDSQQRLSEEIFQFKSKTGVQLQVFIASTLNDEAIESVAIQIFDKWKLGDAKKDNGILFIVAPNERRMRIEVGQGLEGAVPDVIAKRIIEDVVKPSFQKGQFEAGIFSGVAAIENYVITGEGPNLAPEAQAGQKLPVKYLIFAALALFGILFVFSPGLAIQILLSLLAGGRGRGGHYGGGGGGWSGGGGSSSGGGSSGSW